MFTRWLPANIIKSSRPHNLCSITGRTYADIPKDKESKQVMVQGTEKPERVRVRRTRPNDVPRVLRFVREHSRLAWPGLAAPPAQPQVVLCDYVARTLAQGHSMLAEQQEPRSWSKIRGLALCASLCPWDASSLEKWARCVHCTRSRNLMQFTAHCLRGPALHDKYRVHNVLQAVLIVPPDNPKTGEIVNMLAKNTISRGKDVGFPLIRFDVSNDQIAKTLESLNLKKEWQLSYDELPDILRTQAPDAAQDKTHSGNQKKTTDSKNNFIVVYSASTEKTVPKLSPLNKNKLT